MATKWIPRARALRAFAIAATCLCCTAMSGAAEPIIDLDFGNISGDTVPDQSGNANDGVGRMGSIGLESGWSPGTVTDPLGNPAVSIDGTQKQRMEIANRSGSIDVNHFSILVQFTLDQSVDTDPVSQRYELMEKAGSFWMNVREDTSPKYVLRVGGYFNGSAHSLTGMHVIADKTLTWAIGTYDGAHLRTYIADGDGKNLVLDSEGARTGTVDTGPTITGIDENLVVAAKHRMGHFVDGTGGENLEGMFNGTMSRFMVFDTALTQDEIASVIAAPATPGKPGAVQGHLVQNSVMGSGNPATVPFQVSWARGTCPSGSKYSVTATTSGNPTVVRTVTALSTRINLVPGATYKIAVDCNGGSTATTNVTVTGYQEGAASYAGTWHNTSLAGAWGGTARYAAGAAAAATFHCTSCRAIAWVTDEDSAHGSAKVYVDGVLKATVNTRSSAPRNRVIVYRFEWPAAGAHALKIVNLASAGHPRTSIDGFLTRN